MNLVDAADAVVLPAMRAVFKDGEVSAFEVHVSDQLEGSVEVSLTAKGERSRDFVAESRFGWGENRDIP